MPPAGHLCFPLIRGDALLGLRRKKRQERSVEGERRAGQGEVVTVEAMYAVCFGATVSGEGRDQDYTDQFVNMEGPQ